LFVGVDELRRLVREVFEYFGRDEVYEDEFYDYFREKGLRMKILRFCGLW